MIEVEYNLTLEDEIDNIEVTNEYVSQLPLLSWQNDYLISIMFLVLNIPYIMNFKEASTFAIRSNFIFAVLSMPQISRRLPIYSWLPKYQIKRSWWQNHNSTKPRKITITDTEFIFERWESYLFLEENKKISYFWDKLKRYFVSDRGIILEFNGENRYFIPQRIFTNQAQIDKFRELLSKY